MAYGLIIEQLTWPVPLFLCFKGKPLYYRHEGSELPNIHIIGYSGNLTEEEHAKHSRRRIWRHPRT